MTIPSMSRCGSLSSSVRSLKVPGSPSSALMTTYFVTAGSLGMNFHLRPVANPAPPRPRRPDLSTSSITASDDMDSARRSEEHTSELQSRFDLVCRLLLEKKKKQYNTHEPS